jgi:hypothetical protein
MQLQAALCCTYSTIFIIFTKKSVTTNSVYITLFRELTDFFLKIETYANGDFEH